MGTAAVLLMTEPPVRALAAPELRAALIACWAVFTVQWWGRLETERDSPAGLAPYMWSPRGLIDVLAVVGIPAAFLAGLREPYAWLPAALWVLKPAWRLPGLVRLGRVLAREATALTAVGVLFLMIMMITSTVIYGAESPRQPGAFGTLPGTLWWEIETIAGIRAGDAAPLTVPGRLAAGVVTIAFLGVFGLWTSLMATGFVAVSQRETFLRNWEMIAKVPLFRSLGPAAIAEVAEALRSWEVQERTVVFRQGHEGDAMYFIVSGSVRVDTRPEPVVLSDGDFFGEMALLGDGRRTATITTLEPTSLLVLDVADFHKLMASNPDLAAAIDAESQRRLGEAQRATGG